MEAIRVSVGESGMHARWLKGKHCQAQAQIVISSTVRATAWVPVPRQMVTRFSCSGAFFSTVPRTYRAPKSQLSNFNLLVLRSWSFNMFLCSKNQDDCEVWWLRTSSMRRYKGICGTELDPKSFRTFDRPQVAFPIYAIARRRRSKKPKVSISKLSFVTGCTTISLFHHCGQNYVKFSGSYWGLRRTKPQN